MERKVRYFTRSSKRTVEEELQNQNSLEKKHEHTSNVKVTDSVIANSDNQTSEISEPKVEEKATENPGTGHPVRGNKSKPTSEIDSCTLCRIPSDQKSNVTEAQCSTHMFTGKKCVYKKLSNEEVIDVNECKGKTTNLTATFNQKPQVSDHTVSQDKCESASSILKTLITRRRAMKRKHQHDNLNVKMMHLEKEENTDKIEMGKKLEVEFEVIGNFKKQVPFRNTKLKGRRKDNESRQEIQTKSGNFNNLAKHVDKEYRNVENENVRKSRSKKDMDAEDDKEHELVDVDNEEQSPMKNTTKTYKGANSEQDRDMEKHIKDVEDECRNVEQKHKGKSNSKNIITEEDNQEYETVNRNSDEQSPKATMKKRHKGTSSDMDEHLENVSTHVDKEYGNVEKTFVSTSNSKIDMNDEYIKNHETVDRDNKDKSPIKKKRKKRKDRGSERDRTSENADEHGDDVYDKVNRKGEKKSHIKNNSSDEDKQGHESVNRDNEAESSIKKNHQDVSSERNGNSENVFKRVNNEYYGNVEKKHEKKLNSNNGKNDANNQEHKPVNRDNEEESPAKKKKSNSKNNINNEDTVYKDNKEHAHKKKKKKKYQQQRTSVERDSNLDNLTKHVYNEYGNEMEYERKHNCKNKIKDDDYQENEPVTQNNEEQSPMPKKKKKKKHQGTNIEHDRNVNNVFKSVGKEFESVENKHKGKSNSANDMNDEDNQEHENVGRDNEKISPMKRDKKKHNRAKDQKDRNKQYDIISDTPKDDGLFEFEGEQESNEQQQQRVNITKHKYKNIYSNSEDTSNEDDTNPLAFSFEFTKDEWLSIQPKTRCYGKSNKIKRRRLGENHPNIFAKYIKSVYPGCVIAMKEHRVKASNNKYKYRKNNLVPFVSARAHCSGPLCSCVFRLTIQDEDSPIVLCKVTGVPCHIKDEVNRRDITKDDRQQMSQKVKDSSAANVFNQNLLNANEIELELGNYSTVPNPAALRKMVSELVSKEQFHNNILYELQLLKKNDDLLNLTYIREIGLDPFTIFMTSTEQIDLMHQLSSKGNLDVYFDATGGIIRKINDQSKPFLYSFVVKLPSETDSIPVSLANLVSTQHTIPRIEHFLKTIQRLHKINRHTLNIRKIETDFSYAIIQASLSALNRMDIKRYLQTCYNILYNDSDVSMTIHHLCASHMIHDFIRNIKQKMPTLSKHARRFANSSFAILQNCSSMKEAVEIYRTICFICLSKSVSGEVNEATASLDNFFKTTKCDSEIDNEEDDEVEKSNKEEIFEEEDTTKMTIAEASPFTKTFTDVLHGVEESIEDDQSEGNALYIPALPKLILKSYLHLFPLWSGVMLCKQGITRDSNSPVENWFKYLKTNILTKKDKRPCMFVMKTKVAELARIKLNEYKGATATKTKTKSRKRKLNVELAEETWDKKSKRSRKNLYHKGRGNTKVTEQENEKSLPRVMKWGARVRELRLSNTCTIDNGLTIMHLVYIENENFRESLESTDSPTLNTVKTVLRLMSDGEFDQAKLVWSRLSPGVDTNLFGDEHEFMMAHLEAEWRVVQQSQCKNPNCPRPIQKRNIITGFPLCMSKEVMNLQQRIDMTMTGYDVYCGASFTDNYDSDTDDNATCTMERTEWLEVFQSSPILVFRIYELGQQKKISEIFDMNDININGQRFIFGGMTMYTPGHFCAVVKYNGEQFWYDDLVGELKKLKTSKFTRYEPLHAMFFRC